MMYCMAVYQMTDEGTVVYPEGKAYLGERRKDTWI